MNSGNPIILPIDARCRTSSKPLSAAWESLLGRLVVEIGLSRGKRRHSRRIVMRGGPGKAQPFRTAGGAAAERVKLKGKAQHFGRAAGAAEERTDSRSKFLPAIALIALLGSSAWLGGCERARGTPAPPPKPAAAADCCEDANANGFPDQAELHSFDDRENFRRWFTWIAEMQFYQISEAWNAEQRDCAGLVRFALREALRRHDRAWFQKMGSQQEPIGPDVRAYNLETGPLGEKLFRTDYGSFKPDDLSDGKFSEYADGRTLKNYNCTFVSRDRSQARPGDLLFFYQPWAGHYPYHVMVFIGRARVVGDEGTDWVVYHTGSSPADAGTVKKVRLGVLDHHPDKRWRPVLTNPSFIGFYRLKILD